MKKSQRGSKTKELLYTIAEYVGDRVGELVDITMAHMSPRDRRILMHGDIYGVREVWRREENRRLKEQLRALQRQRWIEAHKIGDRILYTLTERGWAVVRSERIRQAPMCTNGHCIIVIFDVPETERFVRAQIRYFLKQSGFSQLQRSVWLCRREVLHELRDFIRESKSGQWLRAFKALDV